MQISDDDSAAIVQARRLLQSRRFDDVLTLLRPVMERRPDDPRVCLLTAVALQQAGDAERALSILTSLRKIPSEQYMIALARTRRDLRAAAPALEAYRWAMVLHPAIAEAVQGAVAMRHAIAPEEAPDTHLMKRAAVLNSSSDPDIRRPLATETAEMTAVMLHAQGAGTAAVEVLARHGVAGPERLDILMRAAVYAYAADDPRWEARFWNSTDLLNAALFAGEGSTLLDIGMRTGVVAEMHLACGAASVLGFEPEPRAAENLRHVYAADERVTVEEIALADTNGTATLSVPERVPGASTLNRSFAAAFDRIRETEWREACVQVRRIDDLDLPRFDFWKIDVEGVENAVLHGAQRTLERARPQAVQVEVFLTADGTWKRTVDLLLSRFRHAWILGAAPNGLPRVFALPVAPQDEEVMRAAVGRVRTPIVTASDRPLSDWMREVDLRRLFAASLRSAQTASGDAMPGRVVRGTAARSGRRIP